ncbi:putative protease [Escherichia coli]|uniref:Putative protease n=1 Tax=Escherichia coli TaxID=562 RepID=A0A377BX23_ECOLX|nr:putative protease [Escherichia coli]
MTLLVVGNVDARSVVDQINKTFGELKGKRETPAPVPTLSPLRAEAVSIMTDAGASGPVIYHVGYAVAADS